MQAANSLSDSVLLSRMPILVGCERGASADVIEHLVEVERRSLYLGQACPSLWAYCRERLGYSENEASNASEWPASPVPCQRLWRNCARATFT